MGTCILGSMSKEFPKVMESTTGRVELFIGVISCPG